MCKYCENDEFLIDTDSLQIEILPDGWLFATETHLDTGEMTESLHPINACPICREVLYKGGGWALAYYDNVNKGEVRHSLVNKEMSVGRSEFDRIVAKRAEINQEETK